MVIEVITRESITTTVKQRKSCIYLMYLFIYVFDDAYLHLYVILTYDIYKMLKYCISIAYR